MICTLGYCPPPRPGLHPESFLANLGKFKRTYPLVLLSEHPWKERTVELKHDPEVIAKALDGPHGNVQTLNNLVWLNCINWAVKNKVSHFIYLESDCRVGRDNWDRDIFAEFFGHPSPLVAGGTLAMFNPLHPDARAGWERLSAQNQTTRAKFPAIGYGKEAGPKGDVGVFPIGALGVYDVAWLTKLFKLDDIGHEAANVPAWDHEFGYRLWKEFGPMAFDVVANLNTVYSCYVKDGWNTEAERLELLRSGRVAAVHPCKSEAIL